MISGNGIDPTETHLPGEYVATGMTTACGIVDPVKRIVEHVDDRPTCRQCVAVAKFFRNLRCVDGSIPEVPE